MGTLYISEYAGVVTLGTGDALPVGQEPALKTQTVPIEDQAHMAQPFQTGTRFVRLHADSPCSISFAATATTRDARLIGTEVFGVTPGRILSVIANPGDVVMGLGSDTFAFFRVISDPKAAEQRWNELLAIHNAAKARVTEASESERALTLRETGLDTREKAIAQLETQLKADQQTLGRARSEYEGSVERFTTQQKVLQQRSAERDKALADRRDNLDHEEAAFKEWSAKAKADLEANLAHSIQHEMALHEREDKLAAAENDYKARLARLKELAEKES